MNSLFRVRLSFFLLAVIFLSKNSFSYEVRGYDIVKGEKGVAVNCYNDEVKDNLDQRICEDYSTLQYSQCQKIDSAYLNGLEVAMCSSPEMTFCFKDSDCKELGKGSCVIGKISFEKQFKDFDDLVQSEKIGICDTTNDASGERNTFSQAICNIIVIVTGNTGRGVVACVVIVVGISFFFGKVTWSLVLAVGLGAGAIFGGPAIVSVITGSSFNCNVK